MITLSNIGLTIVLLVTSVLWFSDVTCSQEGQHVLRAEEDSIQTNLNQDFSPRRIKRAIAYRTEEEYENFMLQNNIYLNRVLNKKPANRETLASPVENKILTTSKRISEKKCQEYCNIIKPVKSGKTRIFGGEEARENEFPHMVAIFMRLRTGNNLFKYHCGGSLISENFVLSAAHCCYGMDRSPENFIIKMGALDLKYAEKYYVEQIIIHPQYKTRGQKAEYDDIAIFKLTENIKFKESILPICLYNQDDDPISKAIVTGWGANEKSLYSQKLLKTELDIIPLEKGKKHYSSNEDVVPFGLYTSQICAGVLEGGIDTCDADSGGPLQLKYAEGNSLCSYRLLGITSFGPQICGVPNTMGVYTRVSSYLNWIESIVWPQ